MQAKITNVVSSSFQAIHHVTYPLLNILLVVQSEDPCSWDLEMRLWFALNDKYNRRLHSCTR